MSDFLTRIAGLTLGKTTAVKPRLPGHFAPLTDTLPAEALDDDPLVAGLYGQAPEPDLSQRQPAPGPVPPAPDNRSSGQDSETDRPRQSVATNAAYPTPGATRIEVGGEVTPARASASLLLPPATQMAPANRKPTTRLEWAVPDIDDAGDTEIQASPLLPGNEADPVAMHETGSDPQAPLSPVRPQLLVRTHAASRESAGLPDLPALPETSQPGQSEPVIHVNIGRIEVRASTPSPRQQARPAPARQPSSLSLQDYLARGQSGGKHS